MIIMIIHRQRVVLVRWFVGSAE